MPLIYTGYIRLVVRLSRVAGEAGGGQGFGRFPPGRVVADPSGDQPLAPITRAPAPVYPTYHPQGRTAKQVPDRDPACGNRTAGGAGRD